MTEPNRPSSPSFVELCTSCNHFIRATASVCPFCSADHVPAPRVHRPLAARTRIVMASGAALLAVACSNGETAAETDTDDSQGSGGEVVEGELSDDGSGDATGGPEGSCGEQAEPSCAGVCGSHHHPACMDDPDDPCPAPPYGAPPGEEWV